MFFNVLSYRAMSVIEVKNGEIFHHHYSWFQIDFTRCTTRLQGGVAPENE